MADIEKKMEDIIKQEGGDIREKSASECRRESIQRAESLRATAADTNSDTPKGYREGEISRERESESVEAERSGDIGAAPDTLENTGKTEKPRKYDGRKNLIPTSQLTETERKELARKGGLASARARRKKKDLQDMLSTLLATPATPEMVEKASALGIDASDADTLYDALCVALFGKALSGDAYAFQLIRDSAGDKPTDRSETSVSIMTDKDKEVMAAIERRIKAEKSAADGQMRE